MITSYAFGKMVIGSQNFSSDLIIFPDGQIQKNWRRASGHVLVLEDLTDLVAVKPDLIIAGTGAYGRMDLAPDLESSLKSRGIDIQGLPTAEAVALFNRLNSEQPCISACFHLTC